MSLTKKKINALVFVTSGVRTVIGRIARINVLKLCGYSTRDGGTRFKNFMQSLWISCGSLITANLPFFNSGSVSFSLSLALSDSVLVLLMESFLCSASLNSICFTRWKGGNE